MIATLRFVMLSSAIAVSAMPDFQKLIPNGDRVPSPCNSNEVWRGVGHEQLTGPGPLNPFGLDFLANEKKWNANLCKQDSDGDGKTNGQELGDPDCKWTPGSQPAITDPKKLSHPGICEPLNSQTCKGAKTEFLRGEASCNRIFNVTSTSWCPAIESPDVKSLVLRFKETTLPALETNYFCQTMDVPNDQDYHIIAWEPIISNPEIMHHLVLFICDSKTSEEAILKSGNYTSPAECGLVPEECPNQNIAWGFGVRGQCYNPEAGMAMGKSFYRKVILQIHYNNPMLRANIRDSSGVKIYYTSKMRQYHIANVQFSQGDIVIPPRSVSTTIIGRSFQSSTCARKSLEGAEKYYLMIFGMHMHKFGKRARVYIERQNGSKTMLMDEQYFYDRPKVWSRSHGDAILVYPGDNFVIECTFDTLKNNKWTFFGKNTADEMCLATLALYPRPKNENYLGIGSYGLLDRCYFEDIRFGRRRFCQESEIDMLIERLGSDKKVTLLTECNQQQSGINEKCCDFLKRNNYNSYMCIYDVSYKAIDKLLVPNNTSMDAIINVHSNVVKCINTMYQAKPLEMYSSDHGTLDSSKNFIILVISAIFTWEFLYLF